MQLAAHTYARAPRRNHLRIMSPNEPHDTLPPTSAIDREEPTRPESARPVMAPPARDTQPPRELTEDEKDEEALAIRRSLSPLDVGRVAVDQLITLYQDAKRRDHDYLDPDGRFARQSEERAQRVKRETIRELSQVVDDVAGRPLRELLERVAAGERKDAEQDRQISDLKARLDRLTELFGNELREINTALTELSVRSDPEPPSGALIGYYVLFVEDSQALGRTLERMATMQGARVAIASTRSEAETLFGQRTPDVAVIDLRLGSDDGAALAAWMVRSGLPQQRVICMTGQLADPIAKATGLRVLAKPFGSSELVAAIREALGRPAPQAASE